MSSWLLMQNSDPLGLRYHVSTGETGIPLGTDMFMCGAEAGMVVGGQVQARRVIQRSHSCSRDLPLGPAFFQGRHVLWN